MKTNNVLFLASILAAGFSASMQAGSHHSNSASTAVAAPAPAPAHGAGPALHSGSGNFRYGGGPMISPSQRFSSYRGPVAGQRRFAPGAVTGSYNPARFTSARSRNPGTARSNAFTSNRNGTRGLANATNNHVFARHSASWQPNWNRHGDHWWHGHRCRFVNGSWFIFDLGFYPWYGYPYDYYAYNGYDPYSYGSDYGYGDGYDPGAYQDGGTPYYDNQGVDESSNQNTDSTVAAVQARLARQGYYRGQIDGVLGPATRRALLTYQRRNGLRATGSLTGETLQSFNLRRVAGD
jgi:hypothetical protein